MTAQKFPCQVESDQALIAANVGILGYDQQVCTSHTDKCTSTNASSNVVNRDCSCFNSEGLGLYTSVQADANDPPNLSRTVRIPGKGLGNHCATRELVHDRMKP